MLEIMPQRAVIVTNAVSTTEDRVVVSLYRHVLISS